MVFTSNIEKAFNNLSQNACHGTVHSDRLTAQLFFVADDYFYIDIEAYLLKRGETDISKVDFAHKVCCEHLTTYGVMRANKTAFADGELKHENTMALQLMFFLKNIEEDIHQIIINISILKSEECGKKFKESKDIYIKLIEEKANCVPKTICEIKNIENNFGEETDLMCFKLTRNDLNNWEFTKIEETP